VKGDGVLCKLMTIPKGARSQGSIGPSNMHDYTIQADVYGLIRDGKMGDIGIVAQRYACVLSGAYQRLEVRTWHAQPGRFSAVQDYKFEPDTWYTLKLQTVTEGEKVKVRAKVWKRGEEEPKEFQLEAEDEVANLEGSPGLFGDAKNAEVFYDNLTVTPN
jgi:hypothetical protein